MDRLLFILAVILQAVLLASSCKVLPGTHRYNAEETFRAAEIVILGTYVADFIGEPEGEHPPQSSKHITVDVDCTFKSVNESSIPSKLTLNGNYMYHSCFHSKLEKDQTYIMALSLHAEDPEGFYRIFEPNHASVGTFEPTDANYDAVNATCGFRDKDTFNSKICQSCDQNVTNHGFDPENPESSAGRKVEAVMATVGLVLLTMFL